MGKKNVRGRDKESECAVKEEKKITTKKFEETSQIRGYINYFVKILNVK